MSTLMLRARLLAGVLLLAAAASACGGAAVAGDCGVNDHLTIPVPAQLGGLTVAPSQEARDKVIAEVKTGRTYVCDASVFELRQGPKKDDELRAVFQVLRMSADARPDDLAFRNKIAHQITGTSSSKPEKIHETLVWSGRGNQQLFYIWFHNRFLQVLIVRENPLAANQASGVDVADLLSQVVALKPVVAN